MHVLQAPEEESPPPVTHDNDSYLDTQFSPTRSVSSGGIYEQWHVYTHTMTSGNRI